MRGMKHALRIAVLAVLITVPVAAQENVVAQLGLTADAVKEAIGTLLTAGIFNPGLPARAFKALSPTARGQVAAAGVQWLKAYASSPDFKRQYMELRNARKPEAQAYDTTPEQELQKALEEQKAQLEQARKSIAMLPPEQRKAMEESLARAGAMDTPEMRKMRLDGIKAERAQRTTQYQQELANWTKDYPENPNPLIAKRLREFLDLSAGVDFAAQLKSQNGRMVFENPAYESKGAQWKMCFRAGREATTAARAAVQAWLKELGG
jgi:hypothetical protein